MGSNMESDHNLAVDVDGTAQETIEMHELHASTGGLS